MNRGAARLKVTEALRFAAEPLSLSEPLREDGDAELGDVVEDRSAESPFDTASLSLRREDVEMALAADRKADPSALRRTLEAGPYVAEVGDSECAT